MESYLGGPTEDPKRNINFYISVGHLDSEQSTSYCLSEIDDFTLNPEIPLKLCGILGALRVTEPCYEEKPHAFQVHSVSCMWWQSRFRVIHQLWSHVNQTSNPIPDLLTVWLQISHLRQPLDLQTLGSND